MSRTHPERATARLRAWAEAAARGVATDLASASAGRNAALRDAGLKLGTLVRFGLVAREQAETTLMDASEANGYVRKDGRKTAERTARGGLHYGAQHGELPGEIADLLRDSQRQAYAIGKGVARRPQLDSEPPPRAEVDALWAHARSVIDEPQVAAFLTSRGVDPVSVHDRELARALPVGAVLPRWAGTGASWAASGHRLIIPLFDAKGALRSVLGRDVTRDAMRKSLAPSGYRRRGLVMAEAFGRLILRLGAHPPWWESGPRLRMVVCEGEIDFLVAASQISDAVEHAPAVLGVVAGSWSDSLAARFPNFAEVVIATDPDETGERYAHAICRSFVGRDMQLARWRAQA